MYVRMHTYVITIIAHYVKGSNVPHTAQQVGSGVERSTGPNVLMTSHYNLPSLRQFSVGAKYYFGLLILVAFM